ncbi:MAG TPA: EutN/CcmL family microcompartment protein [Vicinamibacterales bacterium]|jgi:microcompartment protein CcmK/EutM
MIVGTVTAEVYSTINHPFYDAKKLLLVEREDGAGRRTGGYLIAVDTVGAGPGERVLVLDEGSGARQVIRSADGPVRSVIVGIVDEVHAG